MGIFSSIKDAIFGDDDDERADRPAAKAQKSTSPRPAPPGTAAAPKKPGTATAPRPAPVSEVDVEKKLDAMHGADRLNWRSSIVDLMKLLGIDSGFDNRKELAGEMGRTDYSGSAEDNIWLHKRVMQEVARNGGRVPAGLAD